MDNMKLLRKYEKITRKILKASMIHPDILSRNFEHFIMFRMVRDFDKIGVGVAYSLNNPIVTCPCIIPREAITLAQYIFERLGYRADSVYISSNRFYLSYRPHGRREIYAVGECTSLDATISKYRKLLGDRIVFYNQFTGYKAENFKNFLEYIYEGLSLASKYINIVSQDKLNSLVNIINNLSDARAVIYPRELHGLEKVRFHYDGRELIFLELDGKMVMLENTPFKLDLDEILWLPDRYLHILYNEQVAKSYHEKYLKIKEEEEQKRKRVSEIWDKLLPKKLTYIVVEDLEDLRIILEDNAVKIEGEKIASLIKIIADYCEKIYLVSKYYNNYHISYVSIGKSYKHPLKLLYLLRLLHLEGIGAHIVRRRIDVESLPSLALRLTIPIYSKICRKPFLIILVPRRDMEVKYPCEVKVEDGYVISLDREMFLKTLGGGGGGGGV